MSKEGKARKPHPTLSRVLMALASILLVAAIVLTGVAGYFSNTLNSYFTRRQIDTTDAEKQAVYAANTELASWSTCS